VAELGRQWRVYIHKQDAYHLYRHSYISSLCHITFKILLHSYKELLWTNLPPQCMKTSETRFLARDLQLLHRPGLDHRNCSN
jgi:hypothetical protein